MTTHETPQRARDYSRQIARPTASGALTAGAGHTSLSTPVACQNTGSGGLFGEAKQNTTFERLRVAVTAMKDREAVEHLLFVVEELLAPPVDEFWPGIHLTRMEASLFSTLLRRIGNVVPHETLNGAVYPAETWAGGHESVKVTISRLRQKISGTGARIVSQWGVGYRLERDPGVVFPWEIKQ